MDKITPDERWNLTRKYIVKSLFDNFDVFRNGNKDYKAINKLIEAVAKDLDMKVERVKYFLLVDKIFEEYDIEAKVRERFEKFKDSTKVYEIQPDGSKKLNFDMKEHRLAVEKEIAKAKKMEEAWAKYDRENLENLEKQMKEIAKRKKK